MQHVFIKCIKFLIHLIHCNSGIVDMAADIDIIGRVELKGGGNVDGMDNAVVDWHNVVVNVGEVGTGGSVVITIEELWSALCKA